MFTQLMVLGLLILLNAFFAASEIAMISLNDNKIKMMAEDGHKKAQLLRNLLNEPSRFLATIQVGITLAGFLASAFASESFADRLVGLALRLGVPVAAGVLKPIAVALITILLAYFTLVLGELVPKRMAMQNPMGMSMFAITPLHFLSRITGPFVKFLTLSTNFFIRLFGGNPHAEEENVTEEEIRMMVDVGEEKGAIQETEKEMINNIFEFNDKLASDIMTHRTDIVGLPVDSSLEMVIGMMNREKFSRVPVYEESIDNIIGVLHVKDILKYIECDNQEFTLKKIIRSPYFVPESKNTHELFVDMKRNKTHMAVVIDEYGGTGGIITIEDLIEEIVGNIFDEYDEEEKEFEKFDDNTFVFDGTIELEKFMEIMDVELPTEEYDTLSGYIIGQLGRIPGEDELPVLEMQGMVYRVEAIEEKRIARVKVCRTLQTPEPTDK